MFYTYDFECHAFIMKSVKRGILGFIIRKAGHNIATKLFRDFIQKEITYRNIDVK